MTVAIDPVKSPLSPSHFASPGEIKWCPGCGDYAVISIVRKLLAKHNAVRENTCFISGIGCSSRFPYYMGTYGFHTIHGRAPAVATGAKLANPKLNIWIITGDGDALSIGGNHFIHTLRRNLNVKIILLNNQIYGLTKGQASPTSPKGLKTKTSPMGTAESPVNPAALALGAGATFVARALDADVKHLETVLEAAALHQGTAFVEVLQNCVIFNDDAQILLTDKTTRPDHALYLEPNKPMLFGANKEKALILDNLTPQLAPAADVLPSQLLTHNPANNTLAWLLSQLPFPAFPTPLGILHQSTAPTFDAQIHNQLRAAIAKNGKGNLQSLLTGPETWEIA